MLPSFSLSPGEGKRGQVKEHFSLISMGVTSFMKGVYENAALSCGRELAFWQLGSLYFLQHINGRGCFTHCHAWRWQAQENKETGPVF